jgi:hypothetical protein
MNPGHTEYEAGILTMTLQCLVMQYNTTQHKEAQRMKASPASVHAQAMGCHLPELLVSLYWLRSVQIAIYYLKNFYCRM